VTRSSTSEPESLSSPFFYKTAWTGLVQKYVVFPAYSWEVELLIQAVRESSQATRPLFLRIIL
jgi:hypothetical protein